MAQKVNPIAVRLRFNRNPDSSWFSDYYYAILLHQDFNLRNYLNTIRSPTGNQFGLRIGRCIVHHYPKRSLINVFCLAVSHAIRSKQADWHETEARSLRLPSTASKRPNASRLPLKGGRKGEGGPKQGWWSKGVEAYSYEAVIPFTLTPSKEGQSMALRANPSVPQAVRKSGEASNMLAVPAKKHSVAPFVDQINSLLDLDYWAKPPISKERLTTAERGSLRALSISTAKACLNYYVMQYFLSLKLHFSDNPVTARQAVQSFLNQMGLSSTHSEVSAISLSEEISYIKRRPVSKARHFFWSNIQATLSRSNNTFASVIPMKVTSVYQSASLVAQEVASKLEQKRSFRQISRAVFQQVELCHYIKGIRISCSGRLNGAEIAKTECKKYGETSLHVFSDQIDYAHTKAFTPYGILGVKVWISYL